MLSIVKLVQNKGNNKLKITLFMTKLIIDKMYSILCLRFYIFTNLSKITKYYSLKNMTIIGSSNASPPPPPLL